MINEYSHKNQLKKAQNYLHARVGGHALDTVANAIRCAETGYNGVVHIAPSGCMPEVVTRPVLRKACRDHGISLLELTYDEHTAHAGVSTRLEAFVDMLLDLREKKGNE
jgi:predicted nucleotide-binding protein (sugar kinase/HSP70/actin superfamily)